jgi:hypothetical protein
LAGITRREIWVFKVDKVGMTEDRGKCIRLFARIVKKSVKSRLSREKTGRFIARNVFQSIKIAAADPRSRLANNSKAPATNFGGGFLNFSYP